MIIVRGQHYDSNKSTGLSLVFVCQAGSDFSLLSYINRRCTHIGSWVSVCHLSLGSLQAFSRTHLHPLHPHAIRGRPLHHLYLSCSDLPRSSQGLADCGVVVCRCFVVDRGDAHRNCRRNPNLSLSRTSPLQKRTRQNALACDRCNILKVRSVTSTKRQKAAAHFSRTSFPHPHYLRRPLSKPPAVGFLCGFWGLHGDEGCLLSRRPRVRPREREPRQG